MNDQDTAESIELLPKLSIDGLHAPNVNNELRYKTVHGDSTASSYSQESSESREIYAALQNPDRSTIPTSRPSNLSDLIEHTHYGSEKVEEKEVLAIEQVHLDSDVEARYGSSDGIRPLSHVETSSSSSSDGSRRELSRPSTQQEIKGMGSHLSHPIETPDAPWLSPRTDHEARVVMDRVKQAGATNRAAEAFELHLQPDATPDLPIQRERIVTDTGLTWAVRRRKRQLSDAKRHRPLLNAEKQKSRGKTKDTTRLTILIPVFIIVFFTLCFTVYVNLRLA